MRGKTLAYLARPIVRQWAGGLFALIGSAVVVPLLFIHGTRLDHGAVPYLVGALGATAVVFIGSALTARVKRPPMTLSIEKVVFNEVAGEALVQPVLEVENQAEGPVVTTDYRGQLAVGSASYELRRLVGQGALRDSLSLPFLDRMGPLPPGPTMAHLHFVVPGLSQAELVTAIDGPVEVILRVSIVSGRFSWEARSPDLSGGWIDVGADVVAAARKQFGPASYDAQPAPDVAQA